VAGRSQKISPPVHGQVRQPPSKRSDDNGSRDFRSDTRGCEDRSLFRCLLATLGTLCVLVATASTAAAAEAQPFTLNWQAPEGCPSQAQVQEEITSALSHLPGHGAVDVLAEVTLRENEPGFQLRVRVSHEGQSGERVLPIDDCDDASRAAALLVALSVGTPRPQEVVKKVEEPPKKVEKPRPRPLPPLYWSIGAGPHLAMGMAPEVSAGVGLSVAYSRSFWRLSARGAGYAASHHTLPGTDVGGSFSLMTAGGFACAGYPGAPFTFYGCIGGRFDHLKGTGTGIETTYSASTQIGSLAAGFTLEWSLTRRFRLRTEVEAGYPLGEGRFRIKHDPVLVHEVDSLRGEAALELAVAF
jgi:hypothetical protein